jgi:hypothetical protein
MMPNVGIPIAEVLLVSVYDYVHLGQAIDYGEIPVYPELLVGTLDFKIARTSLFQSLKEACLAVDPGRCVGPYQFVGENVRESSSICSDHRGTSARLQQCQLPFCAHRS